MDSVLDETTLSDLRAARPLTICDLNEQLRAIPSGYRHEPFVMMIRDAFVAAPHADPCRCLAEELGVTN